MELILNWVKGILGCLLVMALIQQSIPGKIYRPYLRFFMGIVLILTVLAPLADLSGIAETMETLIGELAYHEETPGWEETLIKGEDWASAQIIQKAREIAEAETDTGTENNMGNIEVIVEVEEVREVPPVVVSGGE